MTAFLDVRKLPEAVEMALTSGSGVIDHYLDLFLKRNVDAEIEARFAAAPAPTRMLKGGR